MRNQTAVCPFYKFYYQLMVIKRLHFNPPGFTSASKLADHCVSEVLLLTEKGPEYLVDMLVTST